MAIITVPFWLPFYGLWKGYLVIAALGERKGAPQASTLLCQPPAAWTPQTDLERTVYAALVLAGEPVNNLKLAALMNVSPGESSRRVTQLEGVIRKSRKGREVLISMP